MEIKKSLVAKQFSEDDTEEEDYGKKSFVHILIEHHLKDPSFTFTDLRDEITTFMAAVSDCFCF